MNLTRRLANHAADAMRSMRSAACLPQREYYRGAALAWVLAAQQVWRSKSKQEAK